MVALIGRELYESSQTKTPPLECPICKKLPLDPDKGPENQNRNLTGSCFDDKKFPNDQKKFQFEQNFKLNEYETCCSLDLRKYMFLDPYIILVWCFVMKLFQNIFLCIFCAKINWIFNKHLSRTNQKSTDLLPFKHQTAIRYSSLSLMVRLFLVRGHPLKDSFMVISDTKIDGTMKYVLVGYKNCIGECLENVHNIKFCVDDTARDSNSIVNDQTIDMIKILIGKRFFLRTMVLRPITAKNSK